MIIKRFLTALPVPMAGVMLGVASLGNLFVIAGFGSIFHLICGVLASLLALGLTLRLVFFFNGVCEDLKNPIFAAVAPTYAMGLMILAGYYQPVVGRAALWLWICAIAVYVVLMVFFTVKILPKIKITDVHASYFIPYVGIVVASTTSPSFGYTAFGYWLALWGILAFGILAVIIIYRYAKYRDLPESTRPLMCILAAPGSLCTVGYVNTATTLSTTLLTVMLAVSTILFLYVLTKLPSLLKLPFYPSYAAMTFPFVITATAMTLGSYLVDFGTVGNTVTLVLAIFEQCVATAMVVCVVIRYCIYLKSQLFAK